MNLIEMGAQTVYITVYGRSFKLLAIAATDTAANEYMQANKFAAVIASNGNIAFLADKRDKGVPC